MNFRKYLPEIVRRYLSDRNEGQAIENRDVSNEIPQNFRHAIEKWKNHSWNNLKSAIKFLLDVVLEDDITNTENVLLLKIIIDDGKFADLNLTQLKKLASKYKRKSIVIFFAAKSETKFQIIWKSKSIQQFFVLWPYREIFTAKDKDVCEFVADFLGYSLENGHFGISKDFIIQSKNRKIQLHDLADDHGYNVLLFASKSGISGPIQRLINYGIPTKEAGNDDVTAQILANQGKHSNVLLELFQMNLPFPPNMNVNDYSGELKNFIEMSVEFHEMIKVKNIQKLEEIINKNPNLQHFFNLNNESAIKVALDLGFIDIYELLISKGLSFAMNEEPSDIWERFKTSDRRKLRDINLKYKKHLTQKHINILMTNTFLTHDEVDEENKRQLVLGAYEALNEIPILQIILKAVAAVKDFQIVFDFFRDSTYRIDPTGNENMEARFYFSGRILIGANQLLNPDRGNEVLACLIHELCHFAILAAFENESNPYRSNDQEAMDVFSKILEFCRHTNFEEELIRSVFDDYPLDEQPSELIVRPAHLMVFYRDKPEILQEIIKHYKILFDYFENVVIPAIERALPDIETRHVYKPTYLFSKLPENKQNEIKNSIVSYKNVEIKLSELFSEYSEVYDKLTPDHISNLLNDVILNFEDPHLHYLNEMIVFKWENMAVNLKEKALNSNSIFQGKMVKYYDLRRTCPIAIESMSSQHIKDIFNGTEIVIGEVTNSEANFYVERKFISEDIEMINFEYKYGHDFVDDFYIRDEHVQKRTFIKTFQEFHDEFLLKNSFDARQEIFNKIRQNSFFKKLSCDLNDEYFQKMHKNSAEIIKEAEIEKIFILSSEAGSGKTVTFENLAIEIKQKYPTQWVPYIDLKNHVKLYKTNGCAENIHKLVEEILNLKSKGEFERKFFEECFKSGNVVFVWNGFDEISPNYNDFVLNLIKYIHENTENIQYVCTRPLYSDQLSKAFKCRTWRLVPFDEDRKREFLSKFFGSQNISSDKIEDNIRRAKEIIEKFQFKNRLPYHFNTPLMLRLIAEVYEDENLLKAANSYQIFEMFIDRKIQIWLERSENLRSNSKKVRIVGALEKIYQKFALLKVLNLFSYTTLGLKMRKLQIMEIEIPQELSHEEISRMGILYINGKNNFEFAHKTFLEFFVAKYFIEEIYNCGNNVDNEEAELRLELFFRLTKEYGNSQKIIIDFMSSYLEINKSCGSKKFGNKISHFLRYKFRKFFIRMLDTNDSKAFEFLFNFFQKDHELLVHLLHVDETETVYTAIFNPNYFALFVDPKEVESLARGCLTDNEFHKFTKGKHQKLKILFGTYFYGLLDIAKVNEFYDTLPKKLKSTSYWEFLNKCKESSTVDEQKELFATAVSPKIYLFYDKIFSNFDLTEYEKFWANNENLFSKNEMQILLGNAIVQYFEIRPSDKIGHEFFFNILLNKIEKFLTDSQIIEMILSKNILHEAHWDEESFMNLWTLVCNHSNFEERKKILLQNDVNDENFYFYNHVFEKKKNYSVYNYDYFFFDFTPFNIFQRSLTVPSASTFDFTNEIYHKHFTKHEIQEMILCSNDFILYVMGIVNEESCKKFAKFLSELFEGNEKPLRAFLERKVIPTNLSALEIVEDFRGLPFSKPIWFKNLRILSNLYDSL